MRYFISEYLFSIINSFIDSAIFLAAALFLVFPRPKKIRKDDVILLTFWLVISFAFFLNGIQLYLFIYKQAVSVSILLIKIMSALMVLFVFLGGYFLFSKLFVSRWIRRIIITCFAMTSIFSLYSIFFKAKPGLKFGEPRLEFGNQVVFSYLTAFLLLIFNFLILAILWKEFQRGNITWENLGLFYKIISVGIFGAISFLRVLYLLPHPWYIRVFYLLIPYFNHLANKEIRKNENKPSI